MDFDNLSRKYEEIWGFDLVIRKIMLDIFSKRNDFNEYAGINNHFAKFFVFILKFFNQKKYYVLIYFSV